MRKKNTASVMNLNRYIAAFIIFTVLLNGFIPRFAITSRDFNVLSQILKSESTLLRFLTLSTLPVNIVNTLLKEKNTARNTKQEKRQKNNEENTANTSSDFSLISFESKINNNNRCQYNFARDLCGAISSGISGQFSYLISLMQKSPPGGDLFIYMIFLMFFFLLPRSSVGENAAMRSLLWNNNAQLEVQGWVFSFDGHCEAKPKQSYLFLTANSKIAAAASASLADCR